MQAWINKPLGCLIGGYHFSSHLSLFGGTTTINQPGFIYPGLTLVINQQKLIDKHQLSIPQLLYNVISPGKQVNNSGAVPLFSFAAAF